MLCEKCQVSNAQVKLHINVNGVKKQRALCYKCYSEERNQLNESMYNTPSSWFSSFKNFPLDDLFGISNAEHNNNNIATQTVSKRDGGSFIDQYGRNLTKMAKANLIDPVIGRNREVNRVIEILNRRNKNNPVLIGEPGVGKTAIAEALALKIANNNCPIKMHNKEVHLLDVASLVANTGIRGQFEQRMKQLINELQQRKNIILFIDEIHLLVGAGSAEGSMDASNILKPALARRQLQVVGATTLNEYRQIEKDAALERRFQPVIVHEPTNEETVTILKGLQQKYEDYHDVTYSKEAIKACVHLSSRYINERFLPDKAIDLMDEAGSKVNLQTKNQSPKNVEVRLIQISREKENALKDENYELAAQLRDEELKLQSYLQKNNKQTRPIINKKHIEQIVEEKTGIPVSKLQDEERLNLQQLEQKLANKVIGQQKAVTKVAKAIRRSRAGLKPKNRPVGSFLFVGPTGVGKTELTKQLAKVLFGSTDAMIRLDMSEYMEKHSISKIIGSPPGYVGHEEAGQLTELVRRNPYSIILLDEIEKAHPDVQHMFLQILDDGRLTDSQGRTVNFKETVIIMTSNAGTGQNNRSVGFSKSDALEESDLLESLGDFFKPEFLNRFDNIIEFNSLSKDDLLKVIDLMLLELQTMLDEKNIKLTVSNEVKEKIAHLGYDPSFGARPLRRVIQEQLEDKITDFILEQPNIKSLKSVLKEDSITVIKE